MAKEGSSPLGSCSKSFPCIPVKILTTKERVKSSFTANLENRDHPDLGFT
jgi:hypothetical protein